MNEGPQEITQNPRPIGTLLSEVEPELVSWLWPGRVPCGKLTILDGDPGTGKSAVMTDIAARVSVGHALPDGSPCQAAGVVLLSAEDGLADTIRPRLEAAGGDPSRVLALPTIGEGDSERLPVLPDDVAAIQNAIEQVNAALVVVDPVMAYLSGRLNAHHDQDMRRALAPLSRLAEKTGAAVVVVRHLNKAAGGNPLYRGGGSIGIIGAARSGLLVAVDPNDENRRVLAPLKNNLAKPPASLTFTLEGDPNGAVRVRWCGESPFGAAQLLSEPVGEEEKSALSEAKEFVHDVLDDGPVAATQIKREAQNAGISKATLRRAKDDLGVRSRKEHDGSWSWSLPPEDSTPKGARVREGEHVEHLEHLARTQTAHPSEGAQGAQVEQATLDEHLDPLGEDPEGQDSVPGRLDEVEAALREWAAEDPDLLAEEPVEIAALLRITQRLDYEPSVGEVVAAVKALRADGGVAVLNYGIVSSEQEVFEMAQEQAKGAT